MKRIDTSAQSWTFTVIRSKGLHLLRPERSWRPLVCITIEDKSRVKSGATWGGDANGSTTVYETVLGLDGQNPNQKEVFVFGPNASSTTKFSVQVFYQPPGKKKAKRTKRMPVACFSCLLGEVVAKQDAQKEYAQLKLQAQSSSKRSKKKNDADSGQAVLYVRVCQPLAYQQTPEEVVSDGYISSHYPETSDYTSSEPPSSPIEPIPIPIPITTTTTAIDRREKRLRKRKKVRGFWLNSDDEDGMVSVTCSEYESEGALDAGYDSSPDKDIDWDEDGDTTLLPPSPEPDQEKQKGTWSWFSAMLDPIIPMHNSFSKGSDTTIVPSIREDESTSRPASPPSQIKLTASPEPQFAQLKPFTPDNQIEFEEDAPEEKWSEYIWRKMERCLCTFTVYGELCAAAKALDSLVEYSKLHHRSQSLGSSLRSNSFSSFRSWRSSPTLVDGDVEGGFFRGGGRYGMTLTVDGHDAGFDILEKDAREKVEKVYSRLQMEWTYVAGLLAALAAVNTAVFAISPDSLFDINSYARPLVATSSVCSGCGIVCVVWFLWWYGWASGVGVGGNATVTVNGGLGGVDGFMTRALDINSTYVSFALTSRIPAGCMLFSALSLMGFLALVAYDASPIIVFVVCSGVAVGMGGQFVVWGIVKMAKGIVWIVRGVSRGLRCVWGKVIHRFQGQRGGEGGGGTLAPTEKTPSSSPPVEVSLPPPSHDNGRDRLEKH
ncbi:hypothetical protein L218DRAFT_985143 [Marasmius fiardii PR-910]|nr:hypothetical protein L218DRAFT_985143 [Marasmius fiardii PR-910]